ncbi:hypothetical protein AWC38_SpisGene16592 [Stylophora pistillata]|uniref:Uncharacterized protein n=1 Tax=Stylophora pistillata TaxID=50429 RepID=A0A2B4RKS6_STYPI|nr:hypothetical protein AWC38_SpisGene16592 [Stylophora pistillata]
MHTVHVLEQLERGYSSCMDPIRIRGGIVCFPTIQRRSLPVSKLISVHRFEFQDRGTVHLRMFVWLKDFNKIKLDVIRADIPSSNKDLARRVLELQTSDRSGQAHFDDKTIVSQADGGQILNLFHPAEAFRRNLRAYISTVLPALKCRLDVQSSDGNGLLLKYAASYVSKWHDAFDSDTMFSVRVGPYDAAYRHLRGLRPREPEMWMSLSAKRIAWSQSRTKKVTVPTPGQSQLKSHELYCRRPEHEKHLSFLDWLRLHDDKGKPYKIGSTLVGLKTRSVFKDDYFYQDLITNHFHGNVEQLKYEKKDELPVAIRYFAAAAFFRSDHALREEFYNDVSEVDADSDESESEEQHSAAMDERQLSELPRTTGHDWRKFILVRGNPTMYTAKKNAASPTSYKGINYFNHFPRQRLLPYGPIKEPTPDSSMLDKAKSIKCEYIKRPKVGLSELADTRDNTAVGKKDVDNLLKYLVKEDAQTDQIFDRMEHLGMMLYVVGGHVKQMSTNDVEEFEFTPDCDMEVSSDSSLPRSGENLCLIAAIEQLQQTEKRNQTLKVDSVCLVKKKRKKKMTEPKKREVQLPERTILTTKKGAEEEGSERMKGTEERPVLRPKGQHITPQHHTTTKLNRTIILITIVSAIVLLNQ